MTFKMLIENFKKLSKNVSSFCPECPIIVYIKFRTKLYWRSGNFQNFGSNKFLLRNFVQKKRKK
ncbi:hypothetical protein BpHYR1_013388 [Brachionus plicatilis]|uniref:Uncharacterized protein n=1 Tax=Brachionus plicatilis TaxID=10195 RepID=A0A3M7T2P5_BRAPC|nr:hypothetical protein BpHYR1_013388 [Brachionus plicatilis]